MPTAEKRRRWRQPPSVASRLTGVFDRRLFPETSLTASPRLDAARVRQTRTAAAAERVASAAAANAGNDRGGGVVVGSGARRRRRPQAVGERRERLQRDGLVDGRAAVAIQIAVTGGGGGGGRRSAAVVQTSAPVCSSYCRQFEPKRLVNACSRTASTLLHCKKISVYTRIFCGECSIF